MKIEEFQKSVHENAKAHGWWDGEERTFGELIALCHSELSEALEEYRNGRLPTETYYSEKDEFGRIHYFATNPKGELKPEGIPSELADVVIRVMDMCEHFGIDLEEAIKEKHKYNQGRPYKHGGKAL